MLLSDWIMARLGLDGDPSKLGEGFDARVATMAVRGLTRSNWAAARHACDQKSGFGRHQILPHLNFIAMLYNNLAGRGNKVRDAEKARFA